MSPLKQIFRHPARGEPICPICHEPVDLQSSKTDELGRAVHEECYVAAIEQKAARPA